MDCCEGGASTVRQPRRYLNLRKFENGSFWVFSLEAIVSPDEESLEEGESAGYLLALSVTAASNHDHSTARLNGFVPYLPDFAGSQDNVDSHELE